MDSHRKRKLYSYRDFVESPSAKDFQPKRRILHPAGSERGKRLSSSTVRRLGPTFDKESRTEPSPTDKLRTARSPQKTKKVKFTAPSQTSGSQTETLAFLTQRDPVSDSRETMRKYDAETKGEVKSPSPESESVTQGKVRGKKKRLKQTKLLFGEGFNHVNHARACRRHKASYSFSSQLSRLAEQVKSPSKKRDSSQSSKQLRESQDKSLHQNSHGCPPKNCGFPSQQEGASTQRDRSQNKSSNKKFRKRRKIMTLSSESDLSSQADVSEDFPSASYKFLRHERQTVKSHEEPSEVVNEHSLESNGKSQSLGNSQESVQTLQSQESQESLPESQLLDSQGFLVTDKNRRRKRENLMEQRPLQTIEEETGEEGVGDEEEESMNNEETYVDEELILQARVKSLATPSREESEPIDFLTEWPSTGGFDIVTGGWEDQSAKKSSPEPTREGRGLPHGQGTRKAQSRSVAAPPEVDGDVSSTDIADSLTRIITQAERFIGDGSGTAGADASESNAPSGDRHVQEITGIPSPDRSVVQNRNRCEKDEGHNETIVSSGSDGEDDRDVNGERGDRVVDGRVKPHLANGKCQLPEKGRGTHSLGKSGDSREGSTAPDEATNVLAPETVDDTLNVEEAGAGEDGAVIPETVEGGKFATSSSTSDEEFDRVVDTAVDKCLRQLKSGSSSSDTTPGGEAAGTEMNRTRSGLLNASGRVVENAASSQRLEPPQTPPTSVEAGVHSSHHDVSQSRDIQSPKRSRRRSRLSITKASEVSLMPTEKVSVSIQTDISVLNDDFSAAFEFYKSAQAFVEIYEREMGTSQSTGSSSEGNFPEGTSAMGFHTLDNGISTQDSLQVPHESIEDVQGHSDLTTSNRRLEKPLSRKASRAARIQRKMRKLERRKKKLHRKGREHIDHDSPAIEENLPVSADTVNGYRMDTSQLQSSGAGIGEQRRVPRRRIENTDNLPNGTMGADMTSEEFRTDQVNKEVVSGDVNRGLHERKHHRMKTKKKGLAQDSRDEVSLPNRTLGTDMTSGESGTDQVHEEVPVVSGDVNPGLHERKHHRMKTKKKGLAQDSRDEVSLPNRILGTDMTSDESGTDQVHKEVPVVSGDVHPGLHERKHHRKKTKKKRMAQDSGDKLHLPNGHTEENTTGEGFGIDLVQEDVTVVAEKVSRELHPREPHRTKTKKKPLAQGLGEELSLPNGRTEVDTAREESVIDQIWEVVTVVGEDVGPELHSRQPHRTKKNKKKKRMAQESGEKLPLPNQSIEAGTSRALMETGIDGILEDVSAVNEDIGAEVHPREPPRTKTKKRRAQNSGRKLPFPNQRKEVDTTGEESGIHPVWGEVTVAGEDVSYVIHPREPLETTTEKKRMKQVSGDKLSRLDQRMEVNTTRVKSGIDRVWEEGTVEGEDLSPVIHPREPLETMAEKKRRKQDSGNKLSRLDQRTEVDTTRMKSGIDQVREEVTVVGEDVSPVIHPRKPHRKLHKAKTKTNRMAQDSGDELSLPDWHMTVDTAREESGPDPGVQEEVPAANEGIIPGLHSRKFHRAKTKEGGMAEDEGGDSGDNLSAAVNLPVETDIPGPEELEILAQQKMSKLIRKLPFKKGRKPKRRQTGDSLGKTLKIAFQWNKQKSSDPGKNGGDLCRTNSSPVTDLPRKKPSKIAVQPPSPTSSDIESIYNFNIDSRDRKAKSKRLSRKKTSDAAVIESSEDETGSVQEGDEEYSRREEKAGKVEGGKEVADVNIFEDEIDLFAEADVEHYEGSEEGGDEDFVDYSRLPDIFVSKPAGYVMMDLTDL